MDVRNDNPKFREIGMKLCGGNDPLLMWRKRKDGKKPGRIEHSI